VALTAASRHELTAFGQALQPPDFGALFADNVYKDAALKAA